jgi:hypothetical protein
MGLARWGRGRGGHCRGLCGACFAGRWGHGGIVIASGGLGFREGKLPRPKVLVRGGVRIIECCAELRSAARVAGVIRLAPETIVTETAVETAELEHSSGTICEECGKPFAAVRSTANDLTVFLEA